MTIDFSTMTIYELIALILSGIAILIPVVKAIWNKFIVVAKLNYYPTGNATLFFNQSGTYLQIDGVFEAKRKPVVIKKMAVSVTRKKDDKKLNLSWSSLISPVNQNLVGNYLRTTERAHPFQINANSMACAFVEFTDTLDIDGKAIMVNMLDIAEKASQYPMYYKSYDEAVGTYQSYNGYLSAKNSISKEFFWEIGKYEIEIVTDYNKRKLKYKCSFNVDESNYQQLNSNIDEVLLVPLKRQYGIPFGFRTASVDVMQKDNG